MSDVKKVTDAQASANFDPERDNEALYDADVAPLIEQLMDVCRARGIPVICAAQFSSMGIASWYYVPRGGHSLLASVAEAIQPPEVEETSSSEPSN